MDLYGASLAAWRERVREETGGEAADALSTTTGDALRVAPLYTAFNLPAAAPFGVAGTPAWVRGTTSVPVPPTVTPLLAGLPPSLLATEIAAEAAGGASRVRVRLDAALEAALPSALPARLALPVTLECGGNVLPAAALALAAGARAAGSSPAPLRVAADPLATLAAEGGLPRPLAHLRRELAWAARSLATSDPVARPLEVSTVVYHEAGAAEALELGLALGATAEYLRWLEGEGAEPATAAPWIGWSLALGRDVFLQIAKLRAARMLWSKLLAACGVDPVPAPHLRVTVSHRTWTRRDPWSNVLRGTTQVFAALAGGADEITPLPFDLLLGEASELGARLARNTPLILTEEGFVGRPLDPGGGAYAIEALTDALARRAWEELIWVEGLGGLAAALTSGALAERLEHSWSEQAARFASGEEMITGVTEFRSAEKLEAVARSAGTATPESPRSPQPRTDAVVALPASADPDAWLDEAVSALHAGASLAQIAVTLPGAAEGPSVTPLPRHRDAETFEDNS